MSDAPEIRPRCDICAQEVTYPEFIFLGNKCIFHADQKSVDDMMSISKLSFVKYALNELEVVRGKRSLKNRRLNHVDFQACVNELKPELHEIDSKGLEKLINVMNAHGRA